MRRYAVVIAAVVSCLCCATVGLADGLGSGLLWDNFLTNTPPPEPMGPGGGYDGQSYFSSEFNDTVANEFFPYGTFAADDAVFGSSVTVQALEWAGAYEPAWGYTAEVIVLDSTLAEIARFGDLPFTVYATHGVIFQGWTAYNGHVEIPDLALAAGHYYFGVRLVSDLLPNQTRPGRNVMLTTGEGSTNGLTSGAVFAPIIGIDTFTLYTDAFPALPARDFALRLYGIPEPATVCLLAIGVLLMRRR